MHYFLAFIVVKVGGRHDADNSDDFM